MSLFFLHPFRILLSKILNQKMLRNRTLDKLLQKKIDYIECSICKSKKISIIHFNSESTLIKKYYCHNCDHIFSNNLQLNASLGQELFNYQSESKFFHQQLQLQISLLKEIYASSGNILDFGVGGNFQIQDYLSKRYPNFNFYTCDIYQNERKNYFQSYSADSPLHIFDGISSHAVIEHIDNTIDAWTYFNKLLKPIKLGGGIMLHSFPSQINEDLHHWSVQIGSHECIFSEQSLNILCAKTGFKLLKCKIFTTAVHPVFVFRKVFDF